MLTKAQKEELINSIQEANIEQFFKKIDEYKINKPEINQLRNEFILGTHRHDFYTRLQVFANSIPHTHSEIILPKYDIFFSFSSLNTEYARQNVITLQQCGLSVFFSDEDLKKQIGNLFDKIIEKALENSEHFVLFCTPEAMKSTWVEDEYRFFYNHVYRNDREKRRFFILEGVNFNPSLLGGFLKNIQTTTSIDDIVRILGRKTLEDHLAERKEEYQELFELFFEDNIISDKERRQLQSKQRTLELTDNQVNEIENFVRNEKAEQERLVKEAEEKQRLEQERLENERIEREKVEQEKLVKEAEEKQRLEQERLENERIEREKVEQEKLAKEAEEKQRLEQERLENERIEKEKIEQERLIKEAEEKQRLEQERIENERIEKEKIEQERLIKEAEEKRLAEERLEQERIAKEKEEQERLAKQAEEKRLAEEQLEKERIAKEKAEKEEQERLGKQAEEKRLREERLEKERIAKEKAEKEEQERLAKQAEEKRLREERLEKERIAKEKAEKEAEEKEKLPITQAGQKGLTIKQQIIKYRSTMIAISLIIVIAVFVNFIDWKKMFGKNEGSKSQNDTTKIAQTTDTMLAEPDTTTKFTQSADTSKTQEQSTNLITNTKETPKQENGKKIEENASATTDVKWEDLEICHKLDEDGFGVVHKKGFGFRHKKTKKIIIAPKYDEAYNFSDGMAIVIIDGKWGFINEKGKEIIPLKFDIANNFIGGIAEVHLDNRVFYINQRNECVKDCPDDAFLKKYGVKKAVQNDLSKIVFQNINFETGKPTTMTEKDLNASLSPKARSVLDKVSEFLANYPDAKVRLGAHTDDKSSDEGDEYGKEAYNQGLSERMVTAATYYLTKIKGISENRIEKRAFGEKSPMVPNNSEANRALNRRVEIKIIE